MPGFGITLRLLFVCGVLLLAPQTHCRNSLAQIPMFFWARTLTHKVQPLDRIYQDEGPRQA